MFADGTPYSLVEIFRLGKTPSYSGTVLNYKIKAAGPHKTAQNFYRIRRCHFPEANTTTAAGKSNFTFIWCYEAYQVGRGLLDKAIDRNVCDS